MAYDIAGAQQLGNFANAWQQGIQTARTNKAQDLQLSNQQQAAQDQQNLRNLAPGIISGDPDAFAQAAAINPEQATAYQGARDDQLTRLRGAINYIDTQKTPEAKEAAYQNVRPYLDRIGSTNGMTSPATFAEASPLMERARTQIAMIDTTKNLPAGMQEFNALTRAAGYSPGSDDFQKAAQVRLGTSARVVAGGAKTGMITGADGRQRPYIFDPGTQTYSVFDGGEWRPMGQNEASQAASQPIAGGTTQFPQVQSQPSADDRVNNLASQANQMIRSGVPQDQVDAWITQQASSLPGFSTSQTTPTSGVQGSIAVGRSPEEQAALTEAARQTVSTSFLPTQESIKTQAAVQREGQGTTAKGMAERSLAQPQAQLSLSSTSSGLDRMAQSARELLARPGLEGITGIQSRFPSIPGGQSADAQANLDNLKSQIGFAVLQAMRDASKTGGALGSVSDAEGVRLENNLAALQQSQSTEEFRKNLQKIIDYSDQAKSRLTKAFQETYPGSNRGSQLPDQNMNNQNQSGSQDFSHLWGG